MWESRPQRGGRRGGFTLLEVLLVIAILGVLAAIVVPSLLGRQQGAYVDITRTSIHSLESTLQSYAIAHDGKMPEGGTEEMLQALLHPKNAQGKSMSPYLTEKPTDAWGNVLNYRFPGTHQEVETMPDIWSNGPDGSNDDGSGDDVTNWDNETNTDQ